MPDGERPTLSKYLTFAPSCLWGKSPTRDDRLETVAPGHFGDAAQHAIVSPLGELKFANNRPLVLAQINARLKNGSGH